MRARRRPVLHTVLSALAIAAGATACGADAPDTPETTTAPSAHALTADQRRRADQLVSVFENGTPEIQYDYAENLHDGRGVTAGRAGFTTADGDALKVIRAYTRQAPGNPLARFVPVLEAQPDTLPDSDYIAAWKQAAKDPRFRRVQDEQVDTRYYQPAMREADRLGLRTALARAELYDAAIQHGTGSDDDALPALVKQATATAGAPSEAGEKKWLETFLDVRTDDLNHPKNPDTAKEWRESVDRVAAVRRIAHTGNYNLDGPFTVTAFGSRHTIT
ncbi:chitosanase [Streptomyces mashuensis]|uniref:Chitosanase n=1 Tax=Streptomyces mashuensis TaxID=33904 RepID=A0A919B5V6_9ACTN|nr:chitosanase [Streptomyces mashuensis]GHF54329.1 chitosanase [Streptomyces mashuensis]